MPGDYVLNVSVDNAGADLGAFVIASESLLVNDSDSDGDSLVVANVGNAVNGSVELTDDGEILFTPASGSPGAFDYTISDGKGGEATATVAVNGNSIIGTSSEDVLASTPENDLFSGGDGSNTFTFSTGSAHDTIADFKPGSDELMLTDSMAVANMQSLDSDTLVNFDTGDSVLLVGVTGVTDVNDLFA